MEQSVAQGGVGELSEGRIRAEDVDLGQRLPEKGELRLMTNENVMLQNVGVTE